MMKYSMGNGTDFDIIINKLEIKLGGKIVTDCFLGDIKILKLILEKGVGPYIPDYLILSADPDERNFDNGCCHQDACSFYCTNNNRSIYYLVTGFSSDSNNSWARHTWLWDKRDGRIKETCTKSTLGPVTRQKYYGILLPIKLAKQFCKDSWDYEKKHPLPRRRRREAS